MDRQMSDAEEIRRLAELRDQGLITTAEFSKRKRQILKGRRPWWLTILLGIVATFCLVVLLSILAAILLPIVRKSSAAVEGLRVDTVATMQSGEDEQIVLSDIQGPCPDGQADAYVDASPRSGERIRGCWMVRVDSVLIDWESLGVSNYSTYDFKVVPTYPALGGPGSRIRVDGVASLIGRSTD